MDATSEPSTSRILTPDQRPRVFISSTLEELAGERAAAREAIEGLRLIPVMFELGARPHPARALYRAYLAQSHVFIGVYHERYGWVAPGEEVSGLEDEYRLSGQLPRLVYLKAPAPEREERLEDLLGAISDDDTVAYKKFSDTEELRRLIADDLVVLLAERFLPTDGSRSTATSSSPATFAVSPVPRPADSLVGREDDVIAVEKLLEGEARLLTVLGPGGIGKTRLALEVARRAAERQPEQVAFVALDAVTDPHEVLPTVATSIGLGLDSGVSALDALAGAFGSRPFLLVLDNLEQVRAIGTDLTTLLARCPSLTLLLTSRAVLRVRGEQLFHLGPLALHGAGPDAGGGRSAAVDLFFDRARAVQPQLTIDDPADLAAVAELCRRLDGIPLAIEIAAARSRLLPPQDLLDRLGSALDVGSGAADLPERQRTLRDTLAWSEELLTSPQRDLLRWLSVFSAPWTLTDAQAVAGPDNLDILDDVAGLVEHSLVTPHPGAPGEPRFAMYRTVRAYAAERLSEEERAAIQPAFVARMAAQAEQIGVRTASPEGARWAAESRLVWPDVRSAWELALRAEDADVTARFVPIVVPLWLDGRLNDVRPLIDATVALADLKHPARHCDILVAAATTVSNLGDFVRTVELLDHLDRVVPALDDPRGQGLVAMMRGYLAAQHGDLDGCQVGLTRAAELFSSAGTVAAGWFEAHAHGGLGGLHMLKQEPDLARSEFERQLDLGRTHGNTAAHMQSLVFIAGLERAAGELDAARDLLAAAADLVEGQPFYEGNAYCLEQAAAYAVTQGNALGGAHALGLAATMREVIGAKIWALAIPLTDQIYDDVRSALDEPEFEAAFEAGRADDPRHAASVVRAILAGGQAIE